MGNIEWNNLRGANVIEHKTCFVTDKGDLIFWSSYDAYKAQEFLHKISKQPETKIMRNELTAAAIAALNDCTVDGMVVKLGPDQLDRKLYVEVKNALEAIGGAWKGGKVFGFVFKHDPAELLEDLQGGTRRNLKKEFQFFATNPQRAAHLVELAEIDSPDLLVLEPSAGDGAIVKAILAHEPGLCVHAFELMPQNRDILAKIEDCIIVGDDFLKNTFDPNLTFHRIIANPPFANNQDIDHIYEMYRRLKVNGVMVTIASKHWQFASGKKEDAFKGWLDRMDADIEEIESGDFKQSGTNVATCIIKIRKK